MQEALNEWIVLDDENLKFHKGQYQEPYRSSVKFLEFLREKIGGHNRNKILDLGCGAGAVLEYLLTQGNDLFEEGYGIDISSEVIELGKKILAERKTPNCILETGNIFQLGEEFLGKFDGVISLQTFNILPDYRELAEVMCSLRPSWIAFSTLGFEGMIDYKVKLFDYTKEKDDGYTEVFYNIYSLSIMKEYFEKLGYRHFYYKEFEMDIDLPQTNKMGRGTYTVKLESGKRLQISGGMMMPWYFVFVSK